MNKYKVIYKGPGARVKYSAEALLCYLWDHVNISMIETTDFPFNTSDWEGYLPQEDIRTKAVGQVCLSSRISEVLPAGPRNRWVLPCRDCYLSGQCSFGPSGHVDRGGD